MRNHLKRLEPEFYRGQAYVHWSMTIRDRKTGWLDRAFHYKLRELQTHTGFRYELCCPIYCLMPDHLHLLWIGISDLSDQLKAMKFFRTQLNKELHLRNFELQNQAYDHVLKPNEIEHSAFEDVCEYIARNPERAKIVQTDRWFEYEFTGCLMPGYPDLSPFQVGFWELFWSLVSKQRRTWSRSSIEEGSGIRENSF